MKKHYLKLLILLLLILPSTIFAIECSDLNTQKKIINFIYDSKELLPIHRRKVSVQMNISPCEKEECQKKNIKARRKKASLLHIVRNDLQTRNFFIKGQNHPSCLVSKGLRKFRCISCSMTLSDQCRSFAASSSIEGTNLDSEDLQSLGSEDYTYACKDLPKQKGYFKIVSQKVKGDSPYGSVQQYFEKERRLLVKIKYYEDKVLRKVYSISPKKYKNFDGSWMATKIRVRTVQGKESRYLFETMLQVRKKKKKELVYFDLEKDPLLKNTSLEHLFITN